MTRWVLYLPSIWLRNNRIIEGSIRLVLFFLIFPLKNQEKNLRALCELER